MLPARLKLPVLGSDYQDFTLLGQSNLQVDVFPFLVVWLRFILISLNDLVILLVWDFTASGFALVSKEWYTKHGMMEKSKIVVRLEIILDSDRKTEDTDQCNVSAFKPCWTYACDGRHLRCSKQRQAQALSR